MNDDFDYNDIEELQEEEGEDEGAEESRKILQDYQEYWKKLYSPDYPGLSMPAKLQREKLLKKSGEWRKCNNLK